MALGGGVALFAVVGGWWIARFAFRGPDVFATKLVVGGFLVRVVLLACVMTLLVTAAGLDPARFVLWLVAFYFVLLLAEAWILARENRKEGT
jgi:hypothetical protein